MPDNRLKRIDLWILAKLGREPLHGFALAGRLDDDEDAPSVGVATLYRTIDRLHDQELIERHGDTAQGRTQRQRWQLSEVGRRRLAEEAEALTRMARSIRASLGGTGS